MPQGDFTKQEARETLTAVEEMWKALTTNRRIQFLGHLNDITLFIEQAERNAPDETEESR